MDSVQEARHRHAVTRWWANNLGGGLLLGGVVGIVAALVGVHYDVPSLVAMVPALVLACVGAFLLSATPPAPPN